MALTLDQSSLLARVETAITSIDLLFCEAKTALVAGDADQARAMFRRASRQLPVLDELLAAASRM